MKFHYKNNNKNLVDNSIFSFLRREKLLLKASNDSSKPEIRSIVVNVHHLYFSFLLCFYFLRDVIYFLLIEKKIMVFCFVSIQISRHFLQK